MGACAEYHAPWLESEWSEVVHGGNGWKVNEENCEWISSHEWCERTVMVDLCQVIRSEESFYNRLMSDPGKYLDQSPTIIVQTVCFLFLVYVFVGPL